MTSTVTTEFKLTNEIKGLGINRVYAGSNGRGDDEILLFVQRDGVENPLSCKYSKRFKNVAKELKSVLCNSGLDERTAKKFIVLLGKVWIQTEKRQQQTQRNKILQEIRERKKNSKFQSMDEWRGALTAKYEELQRVVADNVPNMWLGLEFELSVLRILNIHGNTLPFIGLLLARPGAGKTQILRVLSDWYCVYRTDDFSARSFVSHNSSFDDDELRERIDMLPQIKNMMFQTPELAPMFTAKDEDLMKNLGIIIKLADGHGLVSNSGAHGRRGYNEDIMFVWMGAVVEIPYRVYKMLGTLGFKMYFFRLPYKEKTRSEVLENMEKDYNKNINNIKSALTEYFYLFEMGPDLVYDNGLNKMPWNSMRDDLVAKEFVAELAMLLQHLRCIVTTWDRRNENYDTEYDYVVSMPEDPDRAAVALFNLVKGHALLTGRNYITMEDIPIVVKTVLSTAKIDRVGLLYLLMERGETWISTDDVMRALNVVRSTALRTMKEFEVIGIVETHEIKEESDTQFTRYVTLRREFRWLTQKKFKELREGFVPVDNRRFITEQNKKANSTDRDPQTRIIDVKPEQVDTFLVVFETMEKEQAAAGYPSEIDRDTVSGEILRKRLIETGKFKDSDDAAMIIDGMQKFRMIEQVSLDTYRRSSRK